jgi:RNA polymerase sigma factor (sigma-70 family)
MVTKAETTVFGHLLGTAPEISDCQLLEAFITRQDAAAFGVLVRRHGPLVFGVCKRVLGHTQDAEDAFQVTFLVLARKAATVVPREALGNWLYGVAYRTARRARAVAIRRRAREKQVETMPEPITKPPRPVPDWEPILDDELSKLADKYRLPLVLCDLEGQPCKQVALRLKIPLGTLFSRLSRARRALAQRLRERGIDSTGGALAIILDGKVVLAQVPHRLVSRTIQAATTVAVGSVTTVPLSANVAALTQGVLKAMFWNKLKVVSAVLSLAVVCLVGGTGTLVSRAVQLDAPMSKLRQAPNEDREQAVKLSYRLGDILSARFFLKNAGKEPVQVSYPRQLTESYYKALQLTDNRGREISIPLTRQHPEPVGWLSCRLASGEQAEVQGNLLALDQAAAKQATETMLRVEPGRSYGVRYTLPNYGDTKAAELQTGTFTFQVIERGVTKPKHLSEEDLKKCIAWGTPGKNGVQVGMLLVPAEGGNSSTRPETQDTADEDREALQGGWEGESGERDGEALADEEIKKVRISIKGDRMLLIPGAEWTPLRIKLDTARNPKVLEATAIEGRDKDKTVPVIYRLDKVADTLTLCFDETHGKAVPRDFAARKGSGLMLLILKHERRAPAAKK